MFAIQASIAEEIARALKASLTGEERAALERRPTTDLAAYDLYLRARAHHLRVGYTDLLRAEELYGQALARDPGFALAHAQLSHVHSLIHWLAYESDPARVDASLDHARAALRLEPELADAHVAMGFQHYYGHRDYQAALAAFARARELRPNDPAAQAGIAFVQRRMARWDEHLT